MDSTTRRAISWWSIPLLLSAACWVEHVAVIEGDGGGDGDADTDTDGDADPGEPGWCDLASIEGHATNRVDLLLVMDNSNSMAEEQAVLAGQVEVLLRELADPAPGPGGLLPPAVDDLHIGVVSTDMGTWGYTIMTCANPMEGDAGLLQSRGRLEGCEPSYSAPGCPRAECPWLAHSTEQPNDGGPADPDGVPIWEELGCVATLGVGGCGFEQPLEASLAALTVQAGPGQPNEGFLRPDSLLVVVYVTDEDDCSTGTPEMFNPTRDDLGHLNVRCALREDMLYPISRYRDAFLGLRPGRPDRVVVAAITGVPIDGRWSPGMPIEALRALRQINPSNPNELLPTCETAMGTAFPPVRIAELVYGFGTNGILESICRSDWTAALTAITRKIQSKLTGSCLAADATPPTGATCRLVETLLDGRPCPYPADVAGPGRTGGWHRDLGLDESGRRLCEILPADYDRDGCPEGAAGSVCPCFEPYEGCLEGWILRPDAAPCPGGRVQVTSPGLVSDGSETSFECLLEGCP